MATKKQKRALHKARCVMKHIAKAAKKSGALARARRACKVKGAGKRRSRKGRR